MSKEFGNQTSTLLRALGLRGEDWQYAVAMFEKDATKYLL